ncbi:DUF167 domain-containing protein [Falsirhodobacter deserti]|uniref:DUF167 domain-containing protein n=1 Tax=Falsirhodobacter deserti TaxID=1365611 RepID=UPI000FE3406C|nr:DUF167 domain-containing protein [Falsirhodobacter deserti]
MTRSGRRIAVRVTPKASRNEVKADGDGEPLRIYVTAAPDDGKANKAVQKLLAKHLRLAPTSLTLLKGATGRDKVFGIEE